VLGFYCAAGLRRARGASGGGLAAQRARTLRRSGLRRTPSPCSDRRSAPSVHFLPDASGARCLRAEELRSRVRGACCSQRAWAARSRPERARGGVRCRRGRSTTRISSASAHRPRRLSARPQASRPHYPGARRRRPRAAHEQATPRPVPPPLSLTGRGAARCRGAAAAARLAAARDRRRRGGARACDAAPARARPARPALPVCARPGPRPCPPATP